MTTQPPCLHFGPPPKKSTLSAASTPPSTTCAVAHYRLLHRHSCRRGRIKVASTIAVAATSAPQQVRQHSQQLNSTMRQFCLTAAALCVVLLAATATAQTTTDANTPPPNATATDPYWPELPAGRSISDYTLNDSASDADLAGATDVARWIIEASNQFRGEFGSQPVTWNETAARVAQNHTNTCLWEHW